MAKIGRPGLPSDKRQEVWERWKAGDSMSMIAKAIGAPPGCQGSPSLTQLAITQIYAPGLRAFGPGAPPSVGDAVAGGGVRSLSSSRSR
jgi:hypothetical protein